MSTTPLGPPRPIAADLLAGSALPAPGAGASQADPTATPAEIEAALKSTAYQYTDGAAYEAAPLGTTSYDKGYGLVDVVAAAQSLG